LLAGRLRQLFGRKSKRSCFPGPGSAMDASLGESIL
jgi:hypothetical protein